jgi:hypothetical protein|eukprot:COSAG01_NODE_1132_length_11565_cov_84.210412_7_plen_58_part_00
MVFTRTRTRSDAGTAATGAAGPLDQDVGRLAPFLITARNGVAIEAPWVSKLLRWSQM